MMENNNNNNKKKKKNVNFDLNEYETSKNDRAASILHLPGGHFVINNLMYVCGISGDHS